MFPPVHAGVAYLFYSASTRLREGRVPTGPAAAAAVVGGVLPDAIDLPLYYLDIAPTTRTVGHSAFVATLLVGPVVLAVRRLGTSDRLALAFAIGYCSHLIADAVWEVVLWIPEELRYLGWPITQQPPYEGTKELATVGEVTVTTMWVELPLLAAAVALWWADGRPGLGTLFGE